MDGLARLLEQSNEDANDRDDDDEYDDQQTCRWYRKGEHSPRGRYEGRENPAACHQQHKSEAPRPKWLCKEGEYDDREDE